jgi:hypothetical protein
MKKYLILIAVVLISLLQACESRAGNDYLDDLYRKYKNKTECVSFSLNGGLIRTFANFDSDEAVDPILKSLDNFRFLTIPIGGEGLSAQDLKELKSFLKNNQFEDLMSVRDNDSAFRILVKEEKGRIREFLMVSDDKDELLILDFRGNIDPDELQVLMDNIEVN